MQGKEQAFSSQLKPWGGGRAIANRSVKVLTNWSLSLHLPHHKQKKLANSFRQSSQKKKILF
jgi:hypothetical protein